MRLLWLQGDCRVTLATLEPGSVQACIGSPPYYALRDYKTPPLVWGGNADHGHTFGPFSTVRDVGRRDGARRVTGHGVFDAVPSDSHGAAAAGSWCACGAWLGSLGLEPMPELYIEHLVECFRHVHRVLRDDGTLWLNLGDSYAGSGKGPSGNNGIGGQSERQGWDGSFPRERGQLAGRGVSGQRSGAGPVVGYKAKDLMMMPARVAMALQADGWYLRSMIPWLKRNSMPESVADRPATSVEYVFLFSKLSRYYWDADAVRVTQSEKTHARFGKNATASTRRKVSEAGSGIKANGSFIAATDKMILPNGRARRNSDWFFESWQGLLLDEQDDPLALVVNPQPFKESHFATFPPKLVEPMVKASTRPGDTVLDPFSGAGTVGLVADRLGRNAVLCELKDGYGEMGRTRIIQDAPMFAQVESR